MIFMLIKKCNCIFRYGVKIYVLGCKPKIFKLNHKNIYLFIKHAKNDVNNK